VAGQAQEVPQGVVVQMKAVINQQLQVVVEQAELVVEMMQSLPAQGEIKVSMKVLMYQQVVRHLRMLLHLYHKQWIIQPPLAVLLILTERRNKNTICV
jgi:hypothetical protein